MVGKYTVCTIYMNILGTPHYYFDTDYDVINTEIPYFGLFNVFKWFIVYLDIFESLLLHVRNFYLTW